jgi:DNA-directed RNA polymerase sigma subunit (sigma70/sigma32)
MKDKNLGIPINQEEIQHYLKDIRRIKVMTPDREKELAVKMKADDTPKREREKIESAMKLNFSKCFSQKLVATSFTFSICIDGSFIKC